MSGEGASDGDASSGGVTGDEAVWRDLVARYDLPADGVSWPEREDLSAPPDGDEGPPRPPRHARPEPADPPEDARQPADASHGPGQPTDAGQGPADPGGTSDQPASPGPSPGADRTRVIRPAAPPPRDPASVPALDPAAAAEEDDEHFIPPPPPPLPHLDPVAKGAWAALFGGPGYLFLTALLGWSVPGWAALLAVMAFVGGFAVVVLRLGDKPSHGEGPDDGAVL